MGDGEQIFSWIHVADVLGAIDHLVDHSDITGLVNLAAPEHVTNAKSMRLIRETMGRSRGLPQPEWLLEAGARIIRTEAELALKSRWVEPAILRDTGYEFAYPGLREALAEIAGNTRCGLLPVALG